MTGPQPRAEPRPNPTDYRNRPAAPVVLMRNTVEWLATWPRSDVPLPPPPWWLMLLYYAALLTMQRLTYDDHGRPVELGNHVYAATRYSFELSLLTS